MSILCSFVAGLLLLSLAVVRGGWTSWEEEEWGGGGEGNVSSCRYKIAFTVPRVVLSGVSFKISVTLPPFISNESESLPEVVYIAHSEQDFLENVTTWKKEDLNGTTPLTFTITDVRVLGYGHHTLRVFVSTINKTLDPSTLICGVQKIVLMAIPAPLTLIPPILTALVAIIFRQVLLALLIGIWMCALFANTYNPLAAILRALDTYFVNSVGENEHAAIIVFSFFLGGLIGVVQRSGGGIGLAKLLFRFTSTRRRACIVCVVLCIMIFFDDYTCVLIAGNSLRSVMDGIGVSRNKFAFILQGVCPTLSSIVPISSWIGVEVGYVQTSFALGDCEDGGTATDPFLIVLKTIPYRFFPLLMIFSVIFVSCLNWDFGPMLNAERSSHAPITLPSEESESSDVELSPRATDSEEEEEGFEGPLAPKKGVPHRWFNAAVPFIIVFFFTLLGMILSGRQNILDMRPEKNIPMTVLNIFTYTNSLSALIWSSALACLVVMVMLQLQKILSLKESMEAWMEGIKDIMEPLIILILAWALGQAIQDIQTSNYIAEVLRDGGLSVGYLPAIVTILGFIMAFATGSAFGTMGILFPLVIPTVCSLVESTSLSSAQKENAKVQATAAILSSSIFGNTISPIADVTILTTVASRCKLSFHLKTMFFYVMIVSVLSVLFGALPVGRNLYPWYAGWIIMAGVFVIIFILFGANSSSPQSRALCRIICPCLYTIPPALFARLQQKFCPQGCCSRCRKKQPPRLIEDKNISPQQSDIEVNESEGEEQMPLLHGNEGLTHRSYSNTS